MKDFVVEFWYIIGTYLLLINIITFIVYGIDKHNAKAGKNRKTGYSNKRRIPEAVLLGFAVCGGSVGAFVGMKLFHHKTKHTKFAVGIPIIFVIQYGILIYALIKAYISVY